MIKGLILRIATSMLLWSVRSHIPIGSNDMAVIEIRRYRMIPSKHWTGSYHIDFFKGRYIINGGVNKEG